MSTDLLSVIDQCADKFRLGHEAEAATILQQVITGLFQVVEHNPTVLSAAAEQSIAASLACQETQDWIGLADELQYVLKPEIKYL